MSSSFLVSAIGMFLGIGIALAHQLFWGRMDPLWVLVSATLIAGLIILVGTGAAEPLAYAIWPALKPEARLVMTRQLESRLDTQLGLMLIGLPLILTFLLVWWRYGSKYVQLALLPGALAMTLLVMSPFPAKLARAVLSDEVVDDLSRQLAAKVERR